MSDGVIVRRGKAAPKLGGWFGKESFCSSYSSKSSRRRDVKEGQGGRLANFGQVFAGQRRAGDHWTLRIGETTRQLQTQTACKTVWNSTRQRTSPLLTANTTENWGQIRANLGQIPNKNFIILQHILFQTFSRMKSSTKLKYEIMSRFFRNFKCQQSRQTDLHDN